jgi:hypothetical protein
MRFFILIICLVLALFLYTFTVVVSNEPPVEVMSSIPEEELSSLNLSDILSEYRFDFRDG